MATVVTTEKKRTKTHTNTLLGSNPDVDPSAASSLTIMALGSGCPYNNQHHSAAQLPCVRIHGGKRTDTNREREREKKQGWEGNFRCNNNFLPGVRTVDEDMKKSNISMCLNAGLKAFSSVDDDGYVNTLRYG